jgi:hypothetical protein
MRATLHRQAGRRVIAGGPAVKLMPDYLARVAEIGEEWPAALSLHNPLATFTSRGCIRRCEFCAVHRIEGDLRELPPDQWEPKPMVIDNNLLACSIKHFDQVIDRLKAAQHTWHPLPVDFNQGLDPRLLTAYHASRLTELHCKIRLSFDHISGENALARALQLLDTAGIPHYTVGVYVLFGFHDTPEDALYRLQTVRKKLRAVPFAMRYQPLNALRMNHYVEPPWTEPELKRFTVYWTRLCYHGSVPFKDFDLARLNRRHPEAR